MQPNILVVDDDRDFLEIMQKRLYDLKYLKVHMEEDPFKAASLFENGKPFDLALLDMSMPGMTGLELLDIIKKNNPDTECIMITAVDEARTAVACLRKGAYDYLVKPVAREDLVLTMHRALEHKRLLDVRDIAKRLVIPEIQNREAFEGIVTTSQRMLRVLKEAELHAASDVPMLITGESGTGKELIARAIHKASPRKSHPFTAINMASLNGNLFDAEFFGHTRGAFTGADGERVGYLEHTDRGSLFLDEIGILPLEIQGKLLRFLQNGQYLKLGSSIDRFADVRIIAATNADLDDLLNRQLFRKDLYYRIRGGWIHLPPLRERKEDIPLLLKAIMKELHGVHKNMTISSRAMDMLMAYTFPGNVRELISIIRAAANLVRGKQISAAALPPYIRQQQPLNYLISQRKMPKLRPLAEVEKEHIITVYKEMNRNKSQTARALGIGLNTLRRKLKAYGRI
jgi:DNA-binding NtrC family response regulator